MRAIALTADQRSSRSGADLVPQVLDRLAGTADLAFERTAGDEVQGLFTAPDHVPRAVEVLVRSGAWTIGIGVGEVEEPLPDHARAGRGPAYVHARTAITRAKGSPVRLAVVGDRDYRAEQAESALWWWAGLLGRRTSRGWEVTDLVAEGLTHEQVARRLGITRSAVTQRIRTAGLAEAERAERLATQLLAEALETED